MSESGGYTNTTFAYFYDHVVPYRDRPDVPFYVEMAKEAGDILELGCGTGRVLLPIARAGVPIYGLDLAQEMLAVCKKKLREEPAKVQTIVELKHADMTDYDLGRTFQLVTIPFRAFQHLTTVEDQLACLRTARRHLNDGGRLVLDVFNPNLAVLARDTSDEFGEEPEFETPEGDKVVRKHRIVEKDFHTQVLKIELIYERTKPDGTEVRDVHAFPMRYLFRYEAEHLLTRCGFAVETVYADYDKTKYGEKYPGELIFVARAV